MNLEFMAPASFVFRRPRIFQIGVLRFFAVGCTRIISPVALRVLRIQHIADSRKQHNNALYAVRHHNVSSLDVAVLILSDKVCGN